MSWTAYGLIAVLSVQATAQALSSPSRSVVTDSAAQTSTSSKWERGCLLRYDFDRAIVFAIDKSGKLVMQSQIAPEQTTWTHIRDLSVSPAGVFAVAFTGLSKEGAPGAFIAWLDASGKTAKLVQLSSAAALRVCFADDGTLWALVRGVDEKFDESKDYDMLRHYDRNGVLIGTALPRKSFSSNS